MKLFKKVVAVLLTAILLISAVSCTPISLTKQWSYKYSDNLLTTQKDIGVYIYALYQAYNQASTYAQESDKYVEGKSFMDIEIKDDDGNKAVAREWILKEAEKIAVNTVTTDYLLKKHNATYDKKDMESAKATAQDIWDVGSMAAYGYFNPMSKELEPHGISFESFFESTYSADVKQTAIFKKLYDKGGEQEVSDEELTKYFTENYVNYSYIPVMMYDSMSDESGNTTNTAFDEKKTKSVEKYVKDAATKINSGEWTVDTAFNKVLKEYTVGENNVVRDKVELFTTTEESNADIAKALKDLKAGEATSITVGADGDTPTAYVVVKNDIKTSVKDYIENEENRSTVLSNCKKEDLQDYVEKTTQELLKSKSLTANTSYIEKYDPNMFFVEPEEETTEAAA